MTSSYKTNSYYKISQSPKHHWNQFFSLSFFKRLKTLKT